MWGVGVCSVWFGLDNAVITLSRWRLNKYQCKLKKDFNGKYKKSSLLLEAVLEA